MFIPEYSTNSIWWDNDTNICLTNHINELQTSINNKAAISHDHPAMIQTINSAVTLTNNYGTFSGTVSSDGFVNGGTYLVSVQYVNSGSLADRTLYAFKFNTSTRLQSTILLVDGKNANDSLYAMYEDGVITFSSQYTGTATAATVRIV